MRRLTAVMMILGLSMGAACADGGMSGTGGESATPFPGSAPSLEALASEVLAALARGDGEALEAFRLTEQEHNAVVWPELPASAPEVNYPVDYAWANIEARNYRSVARIVPLYRDRALVADGVECRGDEQVFETFRVVTDCWVTFHATPSGETYEAQIFKDVLVRGGGFKIFRYYDEEPRRVGVPGASS